MELHVARSVPVAASRLWEVAVAGYSGSETWGRKCLRRRVCRSMSTTPTTWPKPQSCNTKRRTIWNTSLGNWSATPTRLVSPLEKPPHD